MDKKMTLVITLDEQYPNAYYGLVEDMESGSHSERLSAQALGDLYNLAMDWAKKGNNFKVDQNADLKEITEKTRAINSDSGNNTEVIIRLKL